MSKIALLVGICGVLIVAGLRADAEAGNSADASDEISQLKKQISSLDGRTEFVENRLDDGAMMELTPVQPDCVTFRVPGIIPIQQRLRRGSA